MEGPLGAAVPKRGVGPAHLGDATADSHKIPFVTRRLLTSCLTGGRRASGVDRTHFKSRRRQVKKI